MKELTVLSLESPVKFCFVYRDGRHFSGGEVLAERREVWLEQLPPIFTQKKPLTPSTDLLAITLLITT